MMNIEEIFEGFTEEKQKHYEAHLLSQGGVDKQMLQQSKRNTMHWTKADWTQHKIACDKVHEQLIDCIHTGKEEKCPQVQAIIQVHYDLTCKIWTPDKKAYSALAELYSSHADFVDFYHQLDPKLLTSMPRRIRSRITMNRCSLFSINVSRCLACIPASSMRSRVL